jgi:hypothetical protein
MSVWKNDGGGVLARNQDTDKITSGAHRDFSRHYAGAEDAEPQLQLGGSVTLCQVTDIDVPELPKTSTGYDLIRYAESVRHRTPTCSKAQAAGLLQGRQRISRRQPLLVRR